MQLAKVISLLLSLLKASSVEAKEHSNLPVVDLGYELHQAASFNQTTDVYTFSNIRYGQAPVGELRFRAPLPPLVNRTEIQDGSGPRICPQGLPPWQAKAFGPIAMYSNGKPFSLESWENDIENSSVPSGLDFNAMSSEDCLFLDVQVPRSIFEAKSNSNLTTPVLVWIHGGGYSLGSKNGVPTPGYNPSGLLKHAKAIDGKGLIFVSLNYRLGALGFLAGPEVKRDGDLNAGLLDQRLALQWVQDNIHQFGGSSDRVTVIGESAGGGSVLLHLLSSSNESFNKAPFAQVIAQSPAIMPTVSVPRSAYSDFLSLLNVSTLAEARELSSNEIIQANERQIGAAPPTTYIHGPVVDKKVVADLPFALLKKGTFDQSVEVLAAHNSLEGGFFFNPSVRSEAQFLTWLNYSISGLNASQQETLATKIYPPNFQSDIGYSDQDSRQMVAWGEAFVDCGFNALNEALKGRSYAYKFNVTPGLHTQDLKYTFNDPSSPAFNPSAQDVLQQIITSFVLDGRPRVSANGSSYQIPHWGLDKMLLSINDNGFETSLSDVNTTRCAWWQNALN